MAYGVAFGKSMKVNDKGEEMVSDFQHHCRNGVIGYADYYQWNLF